jgi:hypothetical protein
MYLVSGTALSLHYGHRKSVDIDLLGIPFNTDERHRGAAGDGKANLQILSSTHLQINSSAHHLIFNPTGQWSEPISSL